MHFKEKSIVTKNQNYFLHSLGDGSLLALVIALSCNAGCSGRALGVGERFRADTRTIAMGSRLTIKPNNH